MVFIIDRAQIVKNHSIQTYSLLVKNGRIDYMKENFDRLSYMRMDISPFLLTPGHVMLDLSFSPNMTFPQFKAYIQEKFLQRGCTTILFGCHVNSEHEIFHTLKRYRKGLLNCPVDFYFAIKIPIEGLTPSLILQCKKRKIPAVFVEISDEFQLEKVQWGWIRDMVYGYFLPLVPIWVSNDYSKRKMQKLTEEWTEITNLHHVPSIPYCPEEFMPLDKNVLMKIGIYPTKGDIRIGGEVDYNLYDEADLDWKVAQNSAVDYHNLIPKITVHKNKIMKEGKRVIFRPGFGNECVVKVPGYFQSKW